MRKRLSKALDFCWIVTKATARWALSISFTLCTIGALLLLLFGYKALADKAAMVALLTFATIAYIEVLRLKEWGQQNLSDLLNAADKAAAACDKAVEQGKNVEVNGKPWGEKLGDYEMWKPKNDEYYRANQLLLQKHNMSYQESQILFLVKYAYENPVLIERKKKAEFLAIVQKYCGKKAEI